MKLPVSILIFALMWLQGCATPHVQRSTSKPVMPSLGQTSAIMDDGYALPLKIWRPQGESRAVLLALHGMNDYLNGFASTGETLTEQGITLIAYDQRGFGSSEGRGLWHGTERLTRDLRSMLALLRSRYPDQPLYLLGESMGGAVVLAAMRDAPLATDGIILVAPAVWSRDSMPWYQRFALWLAARTFPAMHLTGDGLHIQPTDNIPLWQEWSRDPLVIKSTRVDALYGVSNLMDRAVTSSDHLQGRVLVLYGKQDQVIPREPICRWAAPLPAQTTSHRRTLIYEKGYHMLTRDLQGERVRKDISDWILGREQEEREGLIELERFCEDGQSLRDAVGADDRNRDSLEFNL